MSPVALSLAAQICLLIWRIVFQSPISCAFQVFELAGAQRPQEGDKAKPAKKERRRYQPCECSHDFRTPASRVAFSVTRIDDVDITMAAISGVT